LENTCIPENRPRAFGARKRIMENIQWDPSAFESGINQWSWVSMCHNVNLIEWVYLVIEIVGAFIVAHENSCTHPSGQLFHVSSNTVHVPFLEVKLVCVCMQIKKSHNSFPLVRRTPLVRKARFGFLNLDL